MEGLVKRKEFTRKWATQWVIHASGIIFTWFDAVFPTFHFTKDLLPEFYKLKPTPLSFSSYSSKSETFPWIQVEFLHLWLYEDENMLELAFNCWWPAFCAVLYDFRCQMSMIISMTSLSSTSPSSIVLAITLSGILILNLLRDRKL
jgi:hypothetical protein